MTNRAWVLGFIGSFTALSGISATGCSAGSDSAERQGSGLGTNTSGGNSSTSSGGSTAAAASGNGTAASGNETGDIDVGEIDTDAGPANDNPEVCDGIDNDGNDIVDDVDVGGDGVCDCLNIATIGDLGPWSDGSGIFTTWLAERSPLPVTALGDQVLTDELLAPFQIIVTLHTQNAAVSGPTATAQAHHDFTVAEATAMTKWITNGGGLMTTSGYNYCGQLEESNLNTLIADIGFGYEPGGCVGEDITDWAPHPVTEGLTQIHIVNGGQGNGEGTPLGFDSQKRVALQVIEKGDGRAVMWSDEWITYDSEWVDTENQQVEHFWLNILKWLSPAKECQVPIPPLIR